MSTPDTHRATSFLNHGAGIRTYLGCSCGWKPKSMPQAGSTMHRAYLGHLRTLGLPRPEFITDVYGEGPAKGYTFDEWYAMRPDCDPFGERPCGVLPCAHCPSA